MARSRHGVLGQPLRHAPGGRHAGRSAPQVVPHDHRRRCAFLTTNENSPTSTGFPMHSRQGKGALRALAAALLLSLGGACNAYAEGTLRIAEHYGVVYLLLNVARDQKFIEQEGKQ